VLFFQQGIKLRYINKGSGKVVISKDTEQKLDNFLAGFSHKFISGKSTCFKMISQAFLNDAKFDEPCRTAAWRRMLIPLRSIRTSQAGLGCEKLAN
jgi:hypothetical protein